MTSSTPQPPPDPDLKQAARLLAQGGLVVFPTETYYGIAAAIDRPQALERLVSLKGRTPDKPIALIVGDREQVTLISENIPLAATNLMNRFWPGPLTLILPARKDLHPYLVSSDGGVGVRQSPHPTAARLSQALAKPITATSANLAGKPPVTSPQDLDPTIQKGVDLVLDDGPTPGGPPSTILDPRQSPPLLIRPGAVRVE